MTIHQLAYASQIKRFSRAHNIELPQDSDIPILYITRKHVSGRTPALGQVHGDYADPHHSAFEHC